MNDIFWKSEDKGNTILPNMIETREKLYVKYDILYGTSEIGYVKCDMISVTCEIWRVIYQWIYVNCQMLKVTNDILLVTCLICKMWHVYMTCTNWRVKHNMRNITYILPLFPHYFITLSTLIHCSFKIISLSLLFPKFSQFFHNSKIPLLPRFHYSLVIDTSFDNIYATVLP